MSKNLREVPGIDYNFSQPIRDNVEENISGQKGQVALKIYGEDLDKLVQAAETAKDAHARRAARDVLRGVLRAAAAEARTYAEPRTG